MSQTITKYVIGRIDSDGIEVVDPIEECVSELRLDALTFDTAENAQKCYVVYKPTWKYSAKTGDKVMKITIIVEEVVNL